MLNSQCEMGNTLSIEHSLLNIQNGFMWIFFVLLSALGWALVNVLDSLLVKHYEKNPMVLMWCQSLFSIPVLVAIPFFADVHSSWASILLFFGTLMFFGDLWFFYCLDRLDASVINAAWAILSIWLSIAGFIFFGESWSFLQASGVIFVLSGTFFLSFYHQHVSLWRTAFLLFSLSFLFLPYYAMKKAAIYNGESTIVVFYWMLIGREMLAFTLPWVWPKSKSRVLALAKRMDRRFFLIGGAVVGCFFLGEYGGALAYVEGPLSLVAVLGNIQPFLVIFLAWLMSVLVPSHAPKELLSQESVSIKMVSFTIVFIGLALLATST